MGSLAILGIVSGCSIMPKPLTSEDRNARTAGDLKLIAQLEFVPAEPITLNQAIARAVATIGHKANVKVTTFDFARFGAIEGIVTKISASTFKDRENEVYYKAEIKLKDAFVGDKSKKNRILPGMVTEIDINTGQKTVLRYLLRPVFQSLDVALSER